MSAAKIYVTADLHLGHLKVAQARGFNTTEAHDRAVFNGINKIVGKKDTLILLGDIKFSLPWGYFFNNTICANVRHVMGNHDQLKNAEFFEHGGLSVHGYFEHKSALLSHMPVHESQFERWRLNIHGHLHGKILPDLRYKCVSLEQNNLSPFLLDDLILGA